MIFSISSVGMVFTTYCLCQPPIALLIRSLPSFSALCLFFRLLDLETTLFILRGPILSEL